MQAGDSLDGGGCEAGSPSPGPVTARGGSLPNVFTSGSGAHYQRGEKRLGVGGFGQVYAARELATGRAVALKVAWHEDMPLRDANVSERLGSPWPPNIVQVLDSGVEERRHFVVMELIEGPTLDEWLGTSEAGNRRTSREWLSVLEGVFKGVGALHERSVAHLDLKPRNILLRLQGTQTVPLITDFGLARRMPNGSSAGSTGIGAVTPEYAAPEQVMLRMKPDHRADIFALAVIIIEAITGSAGFRDGKTWALIAGVAPEQLPGRLKEAGLVPDSHLVKVLLKALAERPDDRYQTAAAFWEALQCGNAIALFSRLERAGTIDEETWQAMYQTAVNLRPLCESVESELQALLRNDDAAVPEDWDDAEQDAAADLLPVSNGRTMRRIGVGLGIGVLLAVSLVVIAPQVSGGRRPMPEGSAAMLSSAATAGNENGVATPTPKLETESFSVPEPRAGARSAARKADVSHPTPGPAPLPGPRTDVVLPYPGFQDVKARIRAGCAAPKKPVSSSVIVSYDEAGLVRNVSANPTFQASPAGQCALGFIRATAWPAGRAHEKKVRLCIGPRGTCDR